jgi:amidohydrolase
MRSSRIAVIVTLFAGLAGAPVHAAGLADRINGESERLFPALVEARRWFHQRPELSNREVGTAKEIARRLTAMGYQVQTGIARTGVVAVLHGGLPGPVVAWRTDMDALPIEEQVAVPFRSQNPGVMPACGHDVHMTVALGIAEVLMTLRPEVHGTVKFIFQPAEEGPPAGEKGGASLMVEEGVLLNPAPAAIFGMHVMPTLPVGQVSVRAGGMLAASDEFTITVHGLKSHGSAPHLGVDAVYVAAQLVVGLQEVVSRETDARRPLVVSVGSLHAGNRFNIIADEAVLEGTVRTLDEATHLSVKPAMQRVVDGICQAYRARCELVYERSNPVTSNDPELAAFAAATLRAGLGADKVVEAEPIMAAEDFAHYLREIPGAFLFLGVRDPRKATASYLHTPTFEPDESAILTGVRAGATLLTAYTARQQPAGTR